MLLFAYRGLVLANSLSSKACLSWGLLRILAKFLRAGVEPEIIEPCELARLCYALPAANPDCMQNCLKFNKTTNFWLALSKQQQRSKSFSQANLGHTISFTSNIESLGWCSDYFGGSNLRQIIKDKTFLHSGHFLCFEEKTKTSFIAVHRVLSDLFLRSDL